MGNNTASSSFEGRHIAELRRLVWRSCPAVVLVLSTVGVGVGCLGLLDEAAAGHVELSWIWPTAVCAGLGLTSGTVLVWSVAFRMRRAVEEPTERLAGALRRVRNGDLTVRLDTSQGEVLRPAMQELNLVLEWLNERRLDEKAGDPGAKVESPEVEAS